MQEVKYWRVEEMHEQNLTDGWGSYYPTERTCHLEPVARLPLPLVSFSDVIRVECMGNLCSQSSLSLLKSAHVHTHSGCDKVSDVKSLLM